MLSSQTFRNKNKTEGTKSENTALQWTQRMWKYRDSITVTLAFHKMPGVHVTACAHQGV
jgi:hypothetical protein